MEMKERYQTTRIWVGTLRRLKLIAALTNESLVKLMDRLSEEELERVQQKGKAMKTLLKVLEALPTGTVLYDEQHHQDITVERYLDAMQGHNDMAEPAVLENGKIYFTSEQGEVLAYDSPAFTMVEVRDRQYIESVHDALMAEGKDISLSYVRDYIEQDENRPRDYAIHEIRAIKEQLAAQE